MPLVLWDVKRKERAGSRTLSLVAQLMARRRFFVPAIRNQQAELTGDDARHLTQVLRVEPGQIFEICDNQSVYLAEVDLARKQHVTFRILEKFAAPEPRPRIVLAAALIKFERLETMIEKVTELGVDEIVLIQSARVERGLEKAAGKRMARWLRIALEASQQSRRARLPEIRLPVSFAQALRLEAEHRLLLDEARNGAPLLPSVPSLTPSGSAVILAGPEGGWTDEERATALASGWKPVTLGGTILRAETAAIAAISILTARALESGSAV